MSLNRPALTTLTILAFVALVFAFPRPTQAAEYQNCFTSQSCTIGEFLYDDEYVPDATASCTLTSHNPDGSLYLNAVTPTVTSNAWYSHTFTASTTVGIYPTEICCTTTNDYVCLDKTFQIKTAPSTLTASDVWGYNTRSLTNFGNLIADMWSHTDRTLTSTAGVTSANTADIKEIKKVVKENRVLLEQLINKPIVKTFIDEAKTPTLTSKLDQTKTTAANLYTSIQNLKSRALSLAEKWPILTDSEVKSELTALSNLFKQDLGAKDSSILSATTWLKTSWNSPVLLYLSDQASAAQTKIDNLLKDLSLYNRSYKADAFAPALSHILSLNDLVGTTLAPANELSLFGFIKKTSDQIALLEQQNKNAQSLYAQIKKEPTKDFSNDISKLTGSILALNTVPQVDAFLVKSGKSDAFVQSNKVLRLIALIETNKLLLAGNTGVALKNIWLEEGSIIFRAVAINPSRTLAQNVTVKYYLPSEVKKEQIISHDPALVLDYDPVENAMFASGEVSLAPEETRTFLVEVEDIWSFRQEEINSLKKQVTELVNLLKNTAYFPQATSIKTDIEVTLDKIMLRQNEAITPENRIRTFRENSLEMNGVEEKIASIKELLLASQNTGNFFGGLKSISLWGIVLLIVAGFAFLVMYLNAVKQDAKVHKEHKKPPVKPHDIDLPRATPNHTHRGSGSRLGHRLVKFAVISLITSGLSAMAASSAIRLAKSQSLAQKESKTQVLGTTVEKKYPYQTLVAAPKDDTIPVHQGPYISSPTVKSLKGQSVIFVFKETSGWYQIGESETDSNRNTWINEEYLPKE